MLSARLSSSLSVPLLSAAVLLLTPNALAEKPNNPREPYYYTEYREKWYGWQNILVDVPVLTVFNIAQASGKHSAALGTMGVFVVGSLVVHVLHRRSGFALISGFAHLLLSIGGYALECSILGSIASDASVDTRNAIVITVGGLAAMALDVFALSYEQRETVVKLQSGWVPQVVVIGKAAWVGWQF